MTHIHINDKATISSTKIDPVTGFMRADVVFSRVGIQKYTAGELGLRDRPASDIVNVMRPAAEVFAPESLDSLKMIPMTDDHPQEDVTAANFRKYATGWTGENITHDEEYVRGTVVLTDHDVIRKYQNGKRELSVGYGVELVLKDGVCPKTQTPYQVEQRTIRGNHVALVDAGRCEGACRILDGKCQDCGNSQDASCNCHGGEEMSTGTGPTPAPTLVSRTVDGISIQTTDQGAQVIDKLLGQVQTANDAKKVAEDALKAAKDEHKTAMDAKDGEITGLKAKIPDAAALDALAATRATVIDSVRKIVGAEYDPSGKTPAQMIKDAVSKALGEDAVKDKSEDYLNGVFATLKPTADGDTLRHIVADGVAQTGGTPQQRQANDGKPRGRDAYLARLKAGPQGSSQQKAS